MIDKMRRLELCMRECAATFGWSLSGNCLACSKGALSFLLLPLVPSMTVASPCQVPMTFSSMVVAPHAPKIRHNKVAQIRDTVFFICIPPNVVIGIVCG